MAMPTDRTISIPAASRTYDAKVTPGLLPRLGEFVQSLGFRARIRLIVDSGIPAHIIEAARQSLAHAGCSVAISTTIADEPHKSIASAERLLQELLAARHERNDPIVAIGGGVTTDLAGFVAAIYRRGVPVIHCPTTLLAMVDASVGGKTGVNLALSAPGGTTESSQSCSPTSGELVKNMVGAFWQPRLVLCDTDTLTTLPPRHLRSGLAECLKHGLISSGLASGQGHDGSLWSWTLANLDRCLSLDPAALAELIARNIAVKAGVVGSDEREEAPSSQGGRALLNLGHTFAHAIETLPCLSPDNRPASAPLHHGEAVAYGLIAAAAASHAAGSIPMADVEAVRAAVARLGVAPRLANLPTDEVLIERMHHDKKAAGGKLRLVLLKRLGEAQVVENPPTEVVQAGWAAIRGA